MGKWNTKLWIYQLSWWGKLARVKKLKLSLRALVLRRLLPSDSPWRRDNARNVSFQFLYGGQFTSSTQLINPKFCVLLLKGPARWILNKGVCLSIKLKLLIEDHFAYQPIIASLVKAVRMWGRVRERTFTSLKFHISPFPVALFRNWPFDSDDLLELR